MPWRLVSSLLTLRDYMRQDMERIDIELARYLETHRTIDRAETGGSL